jgi:hypothetical protein
MLSVQHALGSAGPRFSHALANCHGLKRIDAVLARKVAAATAILAYIFFGAGLIARIYQPLAIESAARSVDAVPNANRLTQPGMERPIASAATLALWRSTRTRAAGTRTTLLCAARFAFVARFRESTGLGLRAAGGWLAGATKGRLGLPTGPSSWLAAGACATRSWFAGAGREGSGQSFATLWQRWAGAAEAGTARAGAACVGSAGTGTTFGVTLVLRPFWSGAVWSGTIWTGPINLRPIKARMARFGAVKFGPI